MTKERDNACYGRPNAKVGNDNRGRETIMGSHGLGLLNENGELFTDFCEQNDLVIGSTLFPQLNIHKITWTQNQIDYMTIYNCFISVFIEW